jgi:hypothetical protein
MPFRHPRSDQFFSSGQEEVEALEIQRRQLVRFGETPNGIAGLFPTQRYHGARMALAESDVSPVNSTRTEFSGGTPHRNTLLSHPIPKE